MFFLCYKMFNHVCAIGIALFFHRVSIVHLYFMYLDYVRIDFVLTRAFHNYLIILIVSVAFLWKEIQ